MQLRMNSGKTLICGITNKTISDMTGEEKIWKFLIEQEIAIV